MKPLLPTPEEFRAMVDAAEARQEFWDSRREEFRSEYPNEYVAVRGGHVVAHAPELRTLYAELDRLDFDPLRDVDVEFFWRDGIRLAL